MTVPSWNALQKCPVAEGDVGLQGCIVVEIADASTGKITDFRRTGTTGVPIGG